MEQPHAADLVLVAVLRSPRDLEIARLLGWYRIPVKTAPKTVAVDWLAFYQTARFGAERWSIRYAAPVKGHELTTRADLLRAQPDHPRAGEAYYRLQLGPVQPLPRPIPARRWRRLTFLYTTGERLLAAAELSELVVAAEERALLWQALRDRGAAVASVYRPQAAGEWLMPWLAALGLAGEAGRSAAPDEDAPE